MSLRSSVSKRKGIFPGYWVMLTGALQFGLGQGPVSLGIFMKPLQEAFGWTRAQLSVAASLTRLEGGIEHLALGFAVDKWGPRVLSTLGLIVFSLGLVGLYFVNSLGMFYAVWLLAAIGHNTGYMQVLDKAVADWFVRRRGLMLNIMRALSGALSPLVLMLVSWLLYSYGWREAFLVAGVLILVTGLPLTWLFIKPKRPEYYGWLPDGERIDEELATDTEAAIKAGVDYATKTGEVEFTMRQALRGRTFWIYFVVYALRSLAQPVIGLHLIPFLTDMGLNPTAAAAAMGTMTFMNVPGRLLFGWLFDRFPITRIKYLVGLGLLTEALGVVIILWTTSITWLWVFVVVYGFGMSGGLAVGGGVLRARFWGRKAYATISGVQLGLSALIGIAAPIYAGWVYDTTGSYRTAFILLLITLLAAVVAAFFLNPPKPPEKVGKITEFV